MTITDGTAVFQVRDSRIETLINYFETTQAANSRATIIYPQDSSGQNTSILVNSRYVMNNPFPGFLVMCIPQIMVNGEWAKPGEFIFSSATFSDSGNGGYGVSVNQVLPDDTIVLQTGSVSLTGGANAGYSGSPFQNSSILTSAACRIIVYKLGSV